MHSPFFYSLSILPLIGLGVLAEESKSCPPPATEVHVSYEVHLSPLYLSVHVPENSKVVFGANFTTEITDAPTFLETLVYEARTVEVRSTCVLTSSPQYSASSTPTTSNQIKETSSTSSSRSIASSSSSPVSTSTSIFSTDVDTSSSSASRVSSTSSSSSVSLPAASQPPLQPPSFFKNCAVDPYDPILRLYIIDGTNGNVLGATNPDGAVQGFQGEEEGLTFRVAISKSGLFDLVTDEPSPRYLGVSAAGNYVFVDSSSNSAAPIPNPKLQESVATSIWSIDCNGALTPTPSTLSPSPENSTIQARDGPISLPVPLILLDRAILELVRLGGQILTTSPRCVLGGKAIPASGAPAGAADSCGSFGVTVPYAIDFFDFSPCCDGHDFCFDDCSTTFITCNNNFLSCILSKCSAGGDPVLEKVCTRLGAAFYRIVAGPIGFTAFQTSNLQRCTCDAPPPFPSSASQTPTPTASSTSKTSSTSTPSSTLCAYLRRSPTPFTYLSSPSYSTCIAAMHTRLDYSCNVLVCSEQEYDCSDCADRLDIDPGCYQRCLEISIARCELYQETCPRQYKQGRSQCVNLNLEGGYCFDGNIEECRRVRSDCEIQNDDPGLAYVHPL